MRYSKKHERGAISRGPRRCALLVYVQSLACLSFFIVIQYNTANVHAAIESSCTAITFLEIQTNNVNCVNENACTCTECANDLNTRPNLDRFHSQEPASCQQIKEIFCPWVKCCDGCEQARWHTIQCVLLPPFVPSGVIPNDCPLLDCSAYPLGITQSEAECLDEEPAFKCAAQFRDYIDCFNNNCEQKTACPLPVLTDLVDINLKIGGDAAVDADTNNTDTTTSSPPTKMPQTPEALCQSWNDQCDANTQPEACCPACAGLLGNGWQCAAESIDEAALQSCDVKCASEPTEIPTGAPTKLPTSGGVAIVYVHAIWLAGILVCSFNSV